MSKQRSPSRTSVKVCIRCGEKNTRIICLKCDTRNYGTWILSYISEMDWIILNDDVCNGYAHGKTGNDFLGLPNGIPIHCWVDEYDKNLFYACCDMNKMDEEVWVDEYDMWWDHPSVTKIDFRVNFGIEIVKK